jgi:hypothetical protein
LLGSNFESSDRRKPEIPKVWNSLTVLVMEFVMELVMELAMRL